MLSGPSPQFLSNRISIRVQLTALHLLTFSYSRTSSIKLRPISVPALAISQLAETTHLIASAICSRSISFWIGSHSQSAMAMTGACKLELPLWPSTHGPGTCTRKTGVSLRSSFRSVDAFASIGGLKWRGSGEVGFRSRGFAMVVPVRSSAVVAEEGSSQLIPVLVIGGGGREHALCYSFQRSPTCSKVFCAPGNAGIASSGDAEC